MTVLTSRRGIVDMAPAKQRIMSSAELEDAFELVGEFTSTLDACLEIVRLRKRLEDVQEDLDQAVGYKSAADALPAGEWDRDDH